jgi:putative membrane protein
MGLWWIIGLVFLVALVGIIIWAVNMKRKTGYPEEKTPLEVLKERYARGEIDREEYLEKKKDLGS